MKTIKTLLTVLILFVTISSLKAQKGTLYANFPESFEHAPASDAGYGKKNLELKSGSWTLYGARIDSFANDKPVTGSSAVRMLGNNTKECYLRMNFDVPDGASKVTFWYSSYATKADKSSKFRLEYSTDNGKSWQQTGEVIEAVSKVKQQATYNLDLKGQVRFRIVKLALGSDKNDASIANGRLSLDDFAIYKN